MKEMSGAVQSIWVAGSLPWGPGSKAGYCPAPAEIPVYLFPLGFPAEPLSIQMGTVMIFVMPTVFSQRLPEVPPPHPSGHLPAPAYSCLQALRQENSGSPFRVHPKYSL